MTGKIVPGSWLAVLGRPSRRRGGAALALLLLAGVVWVGGLHAAGARCENLVHTRPEGVGVQTDPHGLCTVYRWDGAVLRQADVDDWDQTELALVLAGVALGIAVSAPRTTTAGAGAVRPEGTGATRRVPAR